MGGGESANGDIGLRPVLELLFGTSLRYDTQLACHSLRRRKSYESLFLLFLGGGSIEHHLHHHFWAGRYLLGVSSSGKLSGDMFMGGWDGGGVGNWMEQIGYLALGEGVYL